MLRFATTKKCSETQGFATQAEATGEAALLDNKKKTNGRYSMFSNSDITRLRQSPYEIIQINHHDVTLHSELTGHDWIIVSYYDASDCYILHRHSRREPYHRQKGNYKSLNEALGYITKHEKWFINHKM